MPRKSNKSKLRQSPGDLLESSQSSSSAATQLDLSQLHKSVTSVLAFKEVVKAYRDGTSEIKDLLEKECDLIYECKVCRNMFRSLINFLSHKRVYCRQNFQAMNHFHFENAEFRDLQVSSITMLEEKSTIMTNSKSSKKDLSSICEKLLRKQFQLNISNQTNKNSSQDVILELTSVDTTQKAVYQSVQIGQGKSSNMKIQVKEVEKILVANRHSMLGPDGKTMNLLPESSAVNLCGICTSRFDTEETLKVHQETFHTPSTLIYQCPSRKNGCPITSTQPKLIIGHLISDHGIYPQKVRKMRDDVNKSVIRVDQIKEVVKQPELRATPIENWDLNVDGLVNTFIEPKLKNTCQNCLRNFARDSTFWSHMSGCTSKPTMDVSNITIRKVPKNAKKTLPKPKYVSESKIPAPRETRKRSRPKEQMAAKKKLRSSTHTRESSNVIVIDDENDKENLKDRVVKKKMEPTKKRSYARKVKVAREDVVVETITKRLRSKTK